MIDRGIVVSGRDLGCRDTETIIEEIILIKSGVYVTTHCYVFGAWDGFRPFKESEKILS